MKRILILGGSGMLGHKLAQLYRGRFETWVTLRGLKSDYQRFGIFDMDRVIEGVDALNLAGIAEALGRIKPDVVINGIGIIKQLKEAKDPLLSLEINSLLPHKLAQLCRSVGTRLIHIGTDCVFSGRKGMYKEEDVADAEDLYGRTKYLGEVSGEGRLTLRTSIIGRELRTSRSLIEWFLSNRGGRVKGFRKAIYSGLTTHAFAGVIAMVIDKHENLHGLYQVSSNPINKYDLLHLVNEAYNAGITIEPDESFHCDRSLDSTLFRNAAGFESPSWEAMIKEMSQDPTPYDHWKSFFPGSAGLALGGGEAVADWQALNRGGR